MALNATLIVKNGTNLEGSSQGYFRGPSIFETEYLKLLREELHIFLANKNFSTIKNISIDFEGIDYVGTISVPVS